MEFFNKTLVALSGVVKTMTPGTRIVAAGSLAFVVASVVWLAHSGAERGDTYLMGGQSFSATQLRDMESAFGKAGLADCRVDGDRVCVPRGQEAKYMAALADAGAMPEDFGEYLRQAVDSGSFMLSGSRQEAKTKIALQSELQLAISRMKGVKKASVLIAEETSQGFPRTKTVTASVAVEPSSSAPVDDATIADIRSYVANAWGGLKPEAVTVVSTTHSPSPSTTERTADAGELLALGQSWPAVGMGGLILTGLAVAWFALRPASRPSSNGAAATADLQKSSSPTTEDSPQPAAASTARPAPQRVAEPAESLREELAVMVRRNPHVAASVLRTWMGNAS